MERGESVQLSNNDVTVRTYEGHVQEYIDGTPQEVSGFIKDWIDESLAGVPKNGAILELGSGFGRDADYIEQKGYNILRTDATHGFVDLLRQQGHEAHDLNAITDDLGGPYDMVFADAVLLHFETADFKAVVKKACDSLVNGGIFAFTVKKGEGEEWSTAKLGEPRYFRYWEHDGLEFALEEANFTDVRIATDPTGVWLHVIAKK